MTDETLKSFASQAPEGDPGSSVVPIRYIPWVPLLAAVIATGIYAIVLGVVAP